MRFGCCTNMIAVNSDGTGVESVELLKELGYEFLELPLAQVMALNDMEFGKLVKRVDSSGMACEVFNVCFPGSIRLTGNEVNDQTVSSYIQTALERAAQLGVDVIIVGSSGARNVPQGFAVDKAWQQLVAMLKHFDELAKPYGITIAIEPLNKLESNIINTTLEGLQLVKDVGCENTKLLVDYYHWALEKEHPDVILTAGEYIRHVHFSRPEGRVFPKYSDADLFLYIAFFNNLKKIGYDNRVSVEAYTKDLRNDAAHSLELLRILYTR